MVTRWDFWEMAFLSLSVLGNCYASCLVWGWSPSNAVFEGFHGNTNTDLCQGTEWEQKAGDKD